VDAQPLETIADLTAAFARGDDTPAAALGRALDRIEAHADLRAVVHVDRERAEDDAKASLERYRRGAARPLEGVPVTVKDIVDLGGVPTRCGTQWLEAPPPAAADAAVVTRLRAAGAGVFAKTRLLEFAYGIVNPADGPVRNPHDLGKTSGGSSSGAAAGVAVGIGAAAVGTDTGGSIRIPAAYCGVWGLKPTYGRVPTQGVFPLSDSLDHVGPLARSAADLLVAFTVMAGDPGAPARERPPRLGVLAGWGRDPARPEVRDAFHRAIDALRSAGVAVEAATAPALIGSEVASGHLIAFEATAIHAGFALRDKVRYAEGTLRQLRGGEAVTEDDIRAARACQDAVRASVDRALADVDALVTVTAPWTAPEEDPPIDAPEGEEEGWYTHPYNLSGHPALSLPLPRGEGLPIGLQLVGRHGEDAALIRTGEWLARALAGT